MCEKMEKKEKKENEQPTEKQTKSVGPQKVSGRGTSSRKAPSNLDVSKFGSDFKNIVRIANTDIPGFMRIGHGLTLIYGISNRGGNIIENILENKINRKVERIGQLKDNEVVELEEIVTHLDKYVPEWVLNKPRQVEDGSAHLITADLKLAQRKDIQRLGQTRSYKGLRHQWGLTVRGQKTRSTGRKASVVGVIKAKEMKGGASKPKEK